MELHVIFLHLAIILFLARIIGDTFGRLGVPPVLGEILVGIILGKSALGIIQPYEALKVLAEIGVILLLFHIGLEADIQQLKRVGLSAVVVAFVGAAMPMLLGTLLSYYLLNLPLTVSLFLGGTLTATSIGITVRVLDDLGKMKERFAQIVLGAAVLDDIIGVVVLAGLYEFSKEGAVHFDALALLILYIATFFLFSPLLAQILARIIQLLSRKLATEDFIPPTVIAVIFFFAFLAHEVGSPEILGAFTAGLALSRRFAIPFALFLRTDGAMAQKVEHTIMPLVWVLTPLFFVYVGLQLNLKAIDFTSLKFWTLSLLILIVAIVGKVTSGFFVSGSLKEKMLIGFSMLPRGEVGLIFAEFGRQAGVYDHTLYAVVIFVVALTTLMAPVVLKFLVRE
ncbi:MAG: cation:proton antiporter [Acidobacteria bacterium]|jgi:Kef-type K+ transport system membrane component KefB|nr:MAG: cation:proton antiporter [Acidobacteriota bacterium]